MDTVIENDKSDNFKNMAVPTESQPITKDVGSALDAVLKHVGEMGTYQRLLFLAMLPFGFCWAFCYLGQMFITATPGHWCRVPELAGLDVELRRNLSIPVSADGEWDTCNVYVRDWSAVLETLTPPDAGTPVVPCQSGWEFEFDDIPYPTVVSEREWVCDRAWRVPASQAISFLGSIVGGIGSGYLADTFGRLPILVVSNLLGCLGGVGTLFTTTFWDFSLCRFIVGMACDTCFLMMYILVMEYVGTRHRTWVANMSIALFFGGGCLLLPFIALWTNNWRHFVMATSLPMLLVLATPFVVPESTRWLVSKGRIDKSVEILGRFERVNGTKIPPDVLEEFVYTCKTTTEKSESVKVLFKSPTFRRMMIRLIISYMSVALVLDGLVRMSETLGGDFFITFALSSATEIPSIASLVFLLDRFGRRRIVFIPMIISGVLAFTGAFVPRGVPSVALAVIARFFNNMSYSAIIQWTPELLPTGVRASGASLVHVSGFASATISPFIVFSERAWAGLPLVLVALISVVGGGMALLLPETMGQPMPQTLADGERLAKLQQVRGNESEKNENANQVRKRTNTSVIP